MLNTVNELLTIAKRVRSLLENLSNDERMRVLDEANFCRHCGEDMDLSGACYCQDDGEYP